MTCRLLDVPCQIWSVIEPWWGWVQIGFWIIVAMAALWALAKLKEIGGWPAVAGAIGAAAYAFGFMRGRGGNPLVPRIDTDTDIDGPDAAPPPRTNRTNRPIRTKPAKRTPLFPNAPWNRRP